MKPYICPLSGHAYKCDSIGSDFSAYMPHPLFSPHLKIHALFAGARKFYQSCNYDASAETQAHLYNVAILYHLGLYIPVLNYNQIKIKTGLVHLDFLTAKENIFLRADLANLPKCSSVENLSNYIGHALSEAVKDIENQKLSPDIDNLAIVQTGVLESKPNPKKRAGWLFKFCKAHALENPQELNEFKKKIFILCAVDPKSLYKISGAALAISELLDFSQLNLPSDNSITYQVFDVLKSGYNAVNNISELGLDFWEPRAILSDSQSKLAPVETPKKSAADIMAALLARKELLK